MSPEPDKLGNAQISKRLKVIPPESISVTRPEKHTGGIMAFASSRSSIGIPWMPMACFRKNLLGGPVLTLNPNQGPEKATF